MLAADGRCKTFDAEADGYVRGEGCGIVVLKRLADAEADGDRIWGVIRGTAVNQDGASAGLTVPNGPAQERVIAEALARAGLEPAEVDYLEAHGTGTPLGDPIEVNAAAAVYGRGRERESPLLIGSVKTNIGHLEAAAGVAGLVKVLLAMNRGVIPRHLHFERPSPRMDWKQLPVRVTAKATEWPDTGSRPVRAGVSSFGFSGTNAHVVVEAHEPPRAVSVPVPGWARAAGDGSPGRRGRRLLPLSGRTDAAVRDLAARYAAWLEERDSESSGESDEGTLLADMAWTAGAGRSHFGRRAGVVFGGAAELRRKLEELSGGGAVATARKGPKVGFVFTGQGSQWAGMGRELYETEPVARAVLERCERAMREIRGASLLEVMFGGAEAAGDPDDTAWTQPALYALESALVELWASAGVRPAAVLGHSVGEIAAARAAGVFGLEDGLRFAAARGELMGSLPAEGPGAGAMLAVFASAARVAAAVETANGEAEGAGLGVAADNGTHQVVSGPTEQVEALAAELSSAGVRVERLNTSHAFHNVLMEPVLEALERVLEEVSVKPPEVTVVSNVTGRAVESGEVMDGAYWRRHARETVAFAEGVRTLAGLGVDAVVEIGPAAVLGPLVALGWPDDTGAGRGPAVVASLRGPRGTAGFAEAAAGAYRAGLAIEFGGLFAGERRRRVSVPRYPFQRKRYWVDERKRRSMAGDHPLLGERHDLAGGEVTFETDLFATDPAWLGDHRVFGRVVAPGALQGSLAATAGFLLGEGEALTVENLRLHAPLIFPERSGADGGRTVQVVAGRPGDGSARGVEIFSRERSGEAWTLHAQGRVSAGVRQSEGERRVDLDALGANLTAGSVDSVYQGLAANGVEAGPLFRVLESIRLARREAVGELALREEVADDGSHAHATLLDGCFQVLASLLGGGGPSYLPFGWDRLWLAGPLPARLVCHARLRTDIDGAGEGTAPEVLTADLDLYKLDGAALGGVSGLTMKRATRAALLASAETGAGSLYRLAWKEQAELGRAALPAGAVLVTGGSETSAAVTALETALARRGVRALAGSGEDPERLLEAAQEAGELAGVVLVAPAQGRAKEPGDATLRWLLGLAQALLEQDAGLEFGLAVVTEAGVAAEPGERVDPESASVWGFARSLQSEQRSLGVRLLDAGGAGAGRSALELLADEAAASLLAEGGESQQALRGGQVLVPRLERERQRMPMAGSWWRIAGRAGLERAETAEAAGREPGAGELTLSLRACGLDGAGGTGGVAGVVMAVGPDVEHVAAGERAFGLAGGALAGRMTLPAEMVRRLPAGLEMARAAAAAAPFVTAALACEEAGLARGEKVLVDAAAAGETGLAAVQLARGGGGLRCTRRRARPSGSTWSRWTWRRCWTRRRRIWRSGCWKRRAGLERMSRWAEAGGGRLDGRFVALVGSGGWVEAPAERVGRCCGSGGADRGRGAGPAADAALPAGRGRGGATLARSGQHAGGIAVTLDEVRFRADASYLVTGGLGALGLEMAEWLAEQGAGHMGLVGRSEPEAEARERLAGLEAATGSRVMTAQADVANADELSTLLARFAAAVSKRTGRIRSGRRWRE